MTDTAASPSQHHAAGGLFVVLVTGSRQLWGREATETIWNDLDRLWVHCRGHGMTMTVRHGCALGVDQIAADWAAWNTVPQQGYPADWDTLGRAAGPIRNSLMLRDGAVNHCLAYPAAGPAVRGSGTIDMITKAARAGVPLVSTPLTVYPKPGPATLPLGL